MANSASFILLDGEDDYSVLRKQGDVLLSVRNGEVIMQRRPAEVLTPSWFTTPAFARS